MLVYTIEKYININCEVWILPLFSLYMEEAKTFKINPKQILVLYKKEQLHAKKQSLLKNDTYDSPASARSSARSRSASTMANLRAT